MAVKMEDISENLHGVIEIIGLENFLKLSKVFGGSNIYIPIYKSVIMPERNRQIIQEYHRGIDIKDLSVKYNLTRQQIEKLVREK